MRAHPLPAAAGWQWLAGGFAIFRRNPLQLGMLVMAYWFILILLNIVPVIGVFLTSLAMPGLSVGLMDAARQIEAGRTPDLRTLVGGLKDNRPTLFALGALYLCGSLGILAVSALLDGGEMLQVLLTAKPGEATPDDLDSPATLLLMLGLLAPLLMAYWFAPVLAAWHGLRVGKSLFFSFVACWMNWRPFLVYSLGLLAVGGVLPSLILLVLLSMFPGLASLATALLVLPLLMIFMPTLFASFYVSYQQVFARDDLE